MTFGVFDKLGIPGPKPLMYMGTVTRHNQIYYLADVECAQKYGKVFGLYELKRPMLVVLDPDMLKTILVKESFNYFTNRRDLYLKGELYDAVAFAQDDHWRRIRNAVTPSFTSGRIKEMFNIIKSYSHKLADSLKAKVHSNEVVAIKDFFAAYSMDAMASCVISVDTQTLKNPSSPLIAHARELFRIPIPTFLFSGFFPVFLPVMKLLGVSFFSNSATAFFKSFVERVREKDSDVSCQKHRDIFQQLSHCRVTSTNKENKLINGLTDHEILSQVTTMLAGYETTASILTFLAYSMATNSQTMRRLQTEIDSTFPNKESIQYEALMRMEYLDCVVSECLRLYPPIARLERVAKETVKINGVTIPKDMLVTVPVYALHRDPELWPEPDEFIPERFSPENKQNINPYTYLPFGIGPRNCLGMRFAQVLVKLALVEVLRSYSFSVCEETEIPLKMSNAGILDTDRQIKLKVVKRPHEGKL